MSAKKEFEEIMSKSMVHNSEQQFSMFKEFVFSKLDEFQDKFKDIDTSGIGCDDDIYDTIAGGMSHKEVLEAVTGKKSNKMYDDQIHTSANNSKTAKASKSKDA